MQEKHLFCVKCQSGKTIFGQMPVVLKNGAVALKGKCPSCESMAYKIVSKEALAQKAEASAASRKMNSHLALMAFVMFAAGLALGAILANVL